MATRLCKPLVQEPACRRAVTGLGEMCAKRAWRHARRLRDRIEDLGINHRLKTLKSPQTNGMIERFNGRIEEVLQSHHFRSGDELESTLHRYVWLHNQ
jgi:transposase InsO family protein